MVSLGVTGYVMFSRVDTNVASLNDHSLPAVKNSTGVERSAFECILDEKNYVLQQKDEIHKKAKDDLTGLMGNLDKVDKVADQFNDAALAAKSKEVRTIAAQYGQLYDQGVDSLKKNKDAAVTMDAKGDLVGGEAGGYMASKKTEYMEAKDALAIVNRINALALETRMNEKGYMIYKDQKYFDVIQRNVTALSECYADLEKLHPDEAEKKQIADARKATQDYFEAARAWVASEKKCSEDNKVLAEKGNLVGSEADAYMASKQTEYTEAKNALAIVNRINALALETRMNEKGYMLYKDQKYFDVIEKNIAELLSCYDQLDTLHPDATEQKQIVDARKATKDYFDAAKAWVKEQKANDKSEQLAALARTMDEAGNTVGKCAADYLAAKQARTDKVAEAVFFVADIAKTALDTRRLANRYMLYQDPKDWEGMNADLTKLARLYDDLRKVSSTKDDQDRIERADKATQEYKVAARSWVDNDSQMKAGAKTMDSGGEVVAAAAATYQARKQGNVEKVAQAVFFVADIAQEALTTRLNEKGYIVTQDARYWSALNDHIARLSGLYDDLRKVSLTKDDQDRIERADKATKEYLVAAKSWVENDNQLHQNILPKMKQIGDTVIANAQTAENDAWGQSDDGSKATTSIVASSKTIIIFALIIGFLVGTAAAILITRSITRPLQNIFKGLKKFSTQELGETGEKFARIIEGLQAGGEQVASAAGQVSAASQSLAQGSSEQAAAIEETTSSVEEMASMTKQNAANANEAKALAANARGGAEKGTEAMARMSKAIDEIKKSSDQTAKIVKTIDEIAFQTNLLALNAAVEAARAGEAGKGFAVVAEEVRNLAQRSAEAAKNTANMIEESVKNANNGVGITKEVAQSLTEIADGARKVNDLVGEIAAACSEQAQGIEQISTAVGQMDSVTQQNAANAEESASASEELSAQAEELNKMVAELRGLVGGADKGRAAEAPPPKFRHDATRAAKTPAAGNPKAKGHPSGAAHSNKPATAGAASKNGGKPADEVIPMENEQELVKF
jgi:methyl-accepting chemotaxis protein